MNERLWTRQPRRMLVAVAAAVGLLSAVSSSAQQAPRSLAEKIEAMERKYDAQFKAVFDALRRLETTPDKPRLDQQSARSVVKTACSLPGGKLNATGFLWHDSLHVVTALHAVAGCTTLRVFTELDPGIESPASIEAVILEADLALLKLKRPLVPRAEGRALMPIKEVTTEPNTRGKFFTWGYPHNVGEMIDLPTAFAGGQKRGITTLNKAFGTFKGFDSLFEGQDYPQEGTSILRVTATIQPGHSGAPILDTQGRVVAIADGGLLNGFAAINWSIPAYKYLPTLRSSKDPIPKLPSKSAVLHSKVTATESKTVAIPADARNSGASAAGELQRVRIMSLADLDALLRGRGSPDNNIKFIKEIAPGKFDGLLFDIYEDPLTGATLGVPSNAQLTWNREIRALEAKSGSGAVSMFVGVLQADSYAEAKVEGKNAFVDKIMNLAKWTGRMPEKCSPSNSPREMVLNTADDVEFANNACFFDGIDETGKEVDINLSITVSGTQLLGYAVYGPDQIENLPPQDLITYLMMQMGAQNLSDFAKY